MKKKVNGVWKILFELKNISFLKGSVTISFSKFHETFFNGLPRLQSLEKVEQY